MLSDKRVIQRLNGFHPGEVLQFVNEHSTQWLAGNQSTGSNSAYGSGHHHNHEAHDVPSQIGSLEVRLR